MQKIELDSANSEGASGVISVLAQDIDNKLRQELTSVYKNLSAEDPVLFIQSMKDPKKYTFTSKKTDEFGFWDESTPWEWHKATPFQNIAEQKTIHGEKYYIQLLWPKPNL